MPPRPFQFAGQRRVLLFTAALLCLLGLSFFVGRSTPGTVQTLSIGEGAISGRGVLSHDDLNRRWVETVSWSPRVFIFHNMLSKAEAQYAVDLAKPRVQRSTVVGRDGRPVVDNARTSSGVFVVGDWAKDPIFEKIENIIADWTHLPRENGEAFYVLRYEVGQRYVPHTDFFNENDEAQKQHQIGPSGNRIATVVICLQEPEEGGETYFPSIDLAVPCRTGSAVLFWDKNPDQTVDPRSQHGGNPVIKGEKWAMTKWIRPRKFGM